MHSRISIHMWYFMHRQTIGAQHLKKMNKRSSFSIVRNVAKQRLEQIRHLFMPSSIPRSFSIPASLLPRDCHHWSHRNRTPLTCPTNGTSTLLHARNPTPHHVSIAWSLTSNCGSWSVQYLSPWGSCEGLVSWVDCWSFLLCSTAPTASAACHRPWNHLHQEASAIPAGPLMRDTSTHALHSR